MLDKSSSNMKLTGRWKKLYRTRQRRGQYSFISSRALPIGRPVIQYLLYSAVCSSKSYLVLQANCSLLGLADDMHHVLADLISLFFSDYPLLKVRKKNISSMCSSSLSTMASFMLSPIRDVRSGESGAYCSTIHFPQRGCVLFPQRVSPYLTTSGFICVTSTYFSYDNDQA